MIQHLKLHRASRDNVFVIWVTHLANSFRQWQWILNYSLRTLRAIWVQSGIPNPNHVAGNGRSMHVARLYWRSKKGSYFCSWGVRPATALSHFVQLVVWRSPRILIHFFETTCDTKWGCSVVRVDLMVLLLRINWSQHASKCKCLKSQTSDV